MIFDQTTLEVCVDTPEGLAAAVRGGADRVELCAALSLQGLTPSPGLMAAAAVVACPVYAMIRPRPGDFVYSALDLEVMRKDIDCARSMGLAGVVIGANRASGDLDAGMLRILIDHAIGLGVTLHRAFDLAPDHAAALETAISLGFERVLTSGGAPSALEGAERLAELTVQAHGRISVMAGGGLTPANVAKVMKRTGVWEVHGSCSGPKTRELGGEYALRAEALGFLKTPLLDTLEASVADMAAILRQIRQARD